MRSLARLLLVLGLGALIAARSEASEAEQELASFRVLDGFEVRLFATEDEGAVKPIAIRFDARGRLWVVGSTVYPQLRPGEVADDKVTILEDTDGDGRADRSTVFAGGFLVPLGLELGDQGAYVSSATELIHVRDRDGDGRADERRVVFRGFGTGDAHQTINSFVWGPSGELMFSQGLHANSRVETPWGLAELRQAGLFRLWPRRLRLEPIWTGAMGAHNPFGTAFDRWGQPFVFAGNGHGIYHLTPALVPTDHFLLHPALWQQGRKFGGADFVENSHWPESHRGEVVTGGYLQNSVERFRFAEAGSTFTVERLPPLIESTNTAFRIVDVRFGPDGALYLCDWHNTLIGHYQTSLRDPGRDRTRGRIWRVTAKNRPLAPRKNLETSTTPELVAELASTQRWNRQYAKRVLAERPTEEVVRELRRRLEETPSPDTHMVFEALGVFASHEVVEPRWLGRLASAPEPEARAYAARMIGHWASRLPDALDRLAPLVQDPHPRVRLEAVVACAYVPDPRAVEIAARATDLPMDSHLDYAFTQVVHATKPRWRDLQARGALRFEDRASRIAAFARADGSGDTVAESAARLARVAEVALDRETVERLANIVATTGGPKDLPVLFRTRTFTVGDTHHASVHARVLETLWSRASNERVLPAGNLPGLLAPLLDHEDTELRNAAIRLAGAWQIDALRDPIASVARDPRADDARRAAAIAALGGYAKQDDRTVLVDLTREGIPAPLRTEAVLALLRFAPGEATRAVADWLARSNGTPIPDDALTRLVAAILARKEGPAALTEAMANVAPTSDAARRLSALVAASGRNVPDLAAVLDRAAGRAPAPPPTLADIPSLAAAVRTSGQPEAGRRIFERPELACVNCHAIDGTPGKIGPDLGALGTSQTVEFILGAILDPQKEVKEGFVAHEIETRDGDVLRGYPRGESDGAVALFDHLANRVVTVRADAIASRTQVGSLMPPGLGAAMTRDELRDLVAFLARLGRRD